MSSPPAAQLALVRSAIPVRSARLALLADPIAYGKSQGVELDPTFAKAIRSRISAADLAVARAERGAGTPIEDLNDWVEKHGDPIKEVRDRHWNPVERHGMGPVANALYLAVAELAIAVAHVVYETYTTTKWMDPAHQIIGGGDIGGGIG